MGCGSGALTTCEATCGLRPGALFAPIPVMAEQASITEGSGGVTLDGTAVVYRLFDIGYEIALDRAVTLLAASGAARTRPARVEAQALQIPNPPVGISLGSHEITVEGINCRAQLAARLFDFGVCSVQLEVPAPSNSTWDVFVRFSRGGQHSPEVTG